MAIFDVRGRQVRTIQAGLLPPGAHVLEWDGRDDGGRPTAPGVYMARIRAGGREVTGRLVRVR